METILENITPDASYNSADDASVSTASSIMFSNSDVEKEFTSIRQLRPALIEEIIESISKYPYANTTEILNFKGGILEDEMKRRSIESQFSSYKERYYQITLKDDKIENPTTYVFQIQDIFATEDDKKYWRYEDSNHHEHSCYELFDFAAYISSRGYAISKYDKAPTWFSTYRKDNYELRKNNLFGIDRDGRVFCTECTTVIKPFPGEPEKRQFEATYAQEITETQFKYIESIVNA